MWRTGSACLRSGLSLLLENEGVSSHLTFCTVPTLCASVYSSKHMGWWPIYAASIADILSIDHLPNHILQSTSHLLAALVCALFCRVPLILCIQFILPTNIVSQSVLELADVTTPFVLSLVSRI